MVNTGQETADLTDRLYEAAENLHGRLIIYNQPNFSMNGKNLAQEALPQINDPTTREAIQNLASIVDKRYETDIGPGEPGENPNSLALEKKNSTLTLFKNEGYKKESYQEWYRRDELAEGYELQVIAVERKRATSDALVDVGVSISDGSNTIQRFYSYATINRLHYRLLVDEIARILTDPLKGREHPTRIIATLEKRELKQELELRGHPNLTKEGTLEPYK